MGLKREAFLLMVINKCLKVLSKVLEKSIAERDSDMSQEIGEIVELYRAYMNGMEDGE